MSSGGNHRPSAGGVSQSRLLDEERLVPGAGGGEGGLILSDNDVIKIHNVASSAPGKRQIMMRFLDKSGSLSFFL